MTNTFRKEFAKRRIDMFIGDVFKLQAPSRRLQSRHVWNWIIASQLYIWSPQRWRHSRIR